VSCASHKLFGANDAVIIATIKLFNAGHKLSCVEDSVIIAADNASCATDTL
jgi:hypothetical protein